MLKTAVVIRHVHFEDLGTFEAVLTAAGYRIHYYDLGVHELWTLDPPLADLLVVLGGPVGVYEADAYPFLAEERRILEARLEAGRPTLGICLGAQQIAATLGATVAPSGIKEIGFSELTLTDAGRVGCSPNDSLVKGSECPSAPPRRADQWAEATSLADRSTRSSPTRSISARSTTRERCTQASTRRSSGASCGTIHSRLVTRRLQPFDTTLERRVVQIGNSALDGVVEPLQP